MKLTTLPLSIIEACDGWNPLAGELTLKTWGQFCFEKMNRVMEFHVNSMTDSETETETESTILEADEGVETLNS